MKQLFYVLSIAVVCLSCNKNNATTSKNVEIYLLKSFAVVANKCQINPDSSFIQDLPVVSNDDIISYAATDYQFELKEAAYNQIKTWKDRTPFAVTVDRKVIYFGFFKPGISSSSCDNSITMDVAWSASTKIILRLGYPSLLPGSTIDDQRNNPALITSLASQGKIK